MDLLQIVLLSAAALVSCTDPQVREMAQEDSKPPSFDYRKAVQPDRWRYRYAQQQKVDAINLGKFMKHPMDYEVPRPIATYEKYHGKGDGRASSNDWFQPRFLRQSEGGRVRVNLHNATDRQDMYGQIVYVHPSLLRESNVKPEGRPQPVVYSMKQLNEPAPVVYSMKQTQAQLNALSDLLGKNPNVQLEGLKRLLHQSPSVIRHPQPFQTKNNHAPKPDAPPKYDKSPLPLPKTPIDKDTLASLQRQFNEASQLQANEVLARAQEQARAHVEAQHMAIAQAQKAIFEKVQNMYQTPQALPSHQPNVPMLVQPNVQVYPTQIPNVIRANPALLQPSTPNPISIAIQEKPSLQQPESKLVPDNIPPKAEPLLSNPIVVTTNVPDFEEEEDTTLKPVNPLKAVILSKNNVNYYAPNHLHEAVAHYQAQKTIRAQVKSNNKAILRAQKGASQNRAQVRHKQKQEQEGGAEEPAAATYQQVVFDQQRETNEMFDQQRETNEIYDGQHDEEQYDDGQYAANYAFGYQINDAKEGNDYGHQEKRNGKSLEGSYHVLLPDGRRQKVEYYADDTGYHAKVTYENFAQH